MKKVLCIVGYNDEFTAGKTYIFDRLVADHRYSGDLWVQEDDTGHTNWWYARCFVSDIFMDDEGNPL